MKLQKEIAELSSMELRGDMEATPKEKTEAAKFLGRLGGKKSVKSRFKGKTKKEISEMMSKLRKGKFTPSQKMADCLNSAVLGERPSPPRSKS